MYGKEWKEMEINRVGSSLSSPALPLLGGFPCQGRIPRSGRAEHPKRAVPAQPASPSPALQTSVQPAAQGFPKSPRCLQPARSALPAPAPPVPGGHRGWKGPCSARPVPQFLEQLLKGLFTRK